MTAQQMCDLLERLALTRSHSRSQVSDDNPYSESQFKSMKYAGDVHAGHGPEKLAQRHAVMNAAVKQYPERFVHGEPKLATFPEAVWINAPLENAQAAKYSNNSHERSQTH